MTWAERTGGSGFTVTPATSREVQRAENSATARSPAIEPSNGTASSPSTSSSRTRCDGRGERVVVVGPGVLAAQPAPEPLQIGAGPGVPRAAHPARQLGGDPGLLQDADPVEVLEIVDGVGDVVGGVHDGRLDRLLPRADRERGPAVEQVVQLGRVGGELGRSRVGRSGQRPAAARRQHRVDGMRVGVALPRPRVLEHGRAHRRGEVEAGAARAVQVDGGDDAVALRVALEAVGQAEPLPGEPVEHLLAEVPERRVAQVVGQRCRLDNVRVAAAQPVDQRVGWPSRSAIARATCATCRLWVSRLCTSRPAPAGLTTWVTPGEPGEERRRGDPVAVDPERAGRQPDPGFGDPRPPRRPRVLIHTAQAIPGRLPTHPVGA